MRKWIPYALAALSCVLLGLAIYAVWQSPGLLEMFGKNGTSQNAPLDANDGRLAGIPPNAMVRRADEEFAYGDMTGAMELYERALEAGAGGMVGGGETAGSDVPVIRKLFDVALLVGDFERAQSALGLMSFRGVSDSMLDPLRGLLLLREGKIEDAKSVFNGEPYRPDYAYGLVLVNIISGEHDAARESLDVLLKSNDPTLVQAARSIQGAYDEFSLFENGKDIHLDTLLARSLAQSGQCPVSIMLLENVVARESQYRDAWIVLGYCSLMLQKNNDALDYFEKAYRLDPQKSETQYFLGLSNERIGNGEEAKQFFEYALMNGFQPRSDVQKSLALLSEESGDYEKAVEYYRDIVYQSNPKDMQAIRSLVTVLIEQMGGVEEARSVVEIARENFDMTADVLDLDGWTALAEGDVDRAAALLSAAVQQDASLAPAWYHKGMLEERVEDYKSALQSYKRAYDLSVGVDDRFAVKAAEKYNRLTKKPR